MSFRDDKRYVGLENDAYGGMTPNGTIIRDAWVFDLLPETETCTGWTRDQFQALYDKVSAAWEPYGHLVRNLPPELAERHRRIYDAAIAKARSLGWSAEVTDDE